MKQAHASIVARFHASALLVCALSASGLADTTFQPAGTLGQWFDPANWSNGLPGPATNTFVGDSKIAVVKGDTAYGGSLAVGYQDGKDGTIEIADTLGSKLSANLNLGAAKNSTGLINMTGGTFDGASVTSIGILGKGVFRQLKGTASHNVLYVGAGKNAGEGEGVYEMNGGWCFVKSAFIGNNSKARVDQKGGLFVVSGTSFKIRSAQGAAYNLSDGLLSVDPDAEIGAVQSGDFLQTGGSAIFNKNVYNGGYLSDGVVAGTGKGSFTISTGAASTKITGTLYNLEKATITIRNKSTVTVGLVDNSRGGTMIVDGAFKNVDGSKTKILNGGTGKITIENEFQRIGVCSIDGDFTQTNGVLAMHVAGFGADQFCVLRGTGNAVLGGSLWVDFLENTNIQLFKPIKIIDFAGGSVTGDFQSVILPTLQDGRSWEIRRGADYFAIEVVPAPAPLGCLAAGLFVATRRRRA